MSKEQRHWTLKEASRAEELARAAVLQRGLALRPVSLPASERLWLRVFLANVGQRKPDDWEDRVLG